MTKKEIAEIRKQFSAKENVRVVAVRLVGPGKRIEMEGTEKFSDLPEDVRDEYVAILKKALDGRNRPEMFLGGIGEGRQSGDV